MWHRCTRSDVSLDYVLGIAGFDLQRTLAQNPGFMDVGAAPTQHDALVSSHSIDQGAPRHLRCVEKGLLDLHLVEEGPARSALPHRAPSPRCTAESMHRVWHRWRRSYI